MSVLSQEALKAEKIDSSWSIIKKSHKIKKEKLFKSFFEIFFNNTPYNDVESWSPDRMYEAAYSFFEFADKKEKDYELLVENKHWDHDTSLASCTLIKVSASNVPFLVDSITEELNIRGLEIDFIAHPMMEVERTAKKEINQIDAFGLESQREHSEAFIYIQLVREVAVSTLKELKEVLDLILTDVMRATNDWRFMLSRMERLHTNLVSIAPIIKSNKAVPYYEYEEAISFLDYLADNHFTFLGYREYDISNDGKTKLASDSGLGVLRDDSCVIFEDHRGNDELPPEVLQFRQNNYPITVYRSTQQSRVHRAVPMDVILVKKYDKAGNVTGECAFVGLFTSVVYAQRVMEIPFLKVKAQRILERSKFRPQTHDYKALVDILEKYPREEMFQAKVDHLLETALGILELKERQRVAVFFRIDDFHRFITAMVFIPRDRFGTNLRVRVQEYLEQMTGGHCDDFNVSVGDSSLARVIYTFKIDHKSSKILDPIQAEEDIQVMARSWGDDLRVNLIKEYGQKLGSELHKKYKSAFTSVYQERTKTRSAAYDIYKLEQLEQNGSITLELYQQEEQDVLGLKLYHKGKPIGLSAILPILENMGLYVITEDPHQVTLRNGQIVWIHNFVVKSKDNIEIDVSAIKQNFEHAFIDIWYGKRANDRLNSLIVKAGLSAENVTIIRTYVRYLKQAIPSLSRGFVKDVVCSYPQIAKLYANYFETKFDPDFDGKREKVLKELEGKIVESFADVGSLSEDTIVRGMYQVLQKTLRTNYYQLPKHDYISLKLKSESIDILPLPRPYREIFVYAPDIEGVHLRGGPIARGGLRWSDRFEDYRTEVLGLMKAQMVKNSVIVPVGSKGGFICKKIPSDATRDEMQAEGIRCYKKFISGLLDVTDNLVKDKVIPAERVVAYDDLDPYLVVAADKGTATFSDIANGRSNDYGFWLDDAFASGGSAGYDHKKMGITAKGGWESVKRHFREMGKDIQEEDFTCVGVGDMSGDVFGNGMLLSKHIKLLAAFNHMHIFVDPNPDSAKSWEERKRMFDLPRSTWMDYDQKLLSKGGRIYDRSAKSLELTPEIQECFGIKKSTITPNEFIKIVLSSKTELLWFGGIGTYIKSEEESHLDAGDRANDALRLNGKEIQAKVIGEGANLGVTQKGRIEYAGRGGRLNADFVDNSAGVDCSDHEVNIKILLSQVMQKTKMDTESRNVLLEKMEDEVSDLVLRNNYQQTQAISLSQTKAANYLETHASFIRSLEKTGMLNREVEYLPSEEEIQERVQNKKGLTRPELSILTSYSKIKLFNDLLESDLVHDKSLNEKWLEAYFPKPIQDQYKKEILSHRLKDQIIATELAGSLVNRMGLAFVKMKSDKTGLSPAQIARAYVIVKEICGLHHYWNAIEALDNKIDAQVQYELLIDVTRLADRLINWFLAHPQELSEDMDKVIKAYQPCMGKMKYDVSTVIVGETKRLVQRRERYFKKVGLSEELAKQMALLPVLGSSCEIIRLANDSKLEVLTVSRFYFALGNRLSLDWLRDQGKLLKMDDYWQAIAINGMVDDLYNAQAQIIHQIMADEKKALKKGEDAKKVIQRWMDGQSSFISQFDEHIRMMKRLNSLQLAHLTIAAQKIRHLGTF